MKKNIYLLISISFLAACSSVKKVESTYIDAYTTYRIDNVQFNLRSKCKSKSYPNEDELKNIFTTKLNKEFCETNNCTKSESADNNIDIKVTAEYKRTFMGEGFGCHNEAYGNGSIIYSYELIKNGKTIFTQASSSEMIANKGLFGNIGTIASQLSFNGNADKELENITIFANAISKDISDKIKNDD